MKLDAQKVGQIVVVHVAEETRSHIHHPRARAFAQPVLLVARTMLGTINHSLLTIEALRARGLTILGIVFVGDPVEDSEATIARIGRVRRLGRLPRLNPLDAGTLAAAIDAHLDLSALA